jgi:hypothetical protein
MVPVWDSLEQREVLVRPYILLFPADNPMQAEQCSSTGLRSNLFCRTCKVGGSQEHKLSDDGYGELFQVCNICHVLLLVKLTPRSVELDKQLQNSRWYDCENQCAVWNCIHSDGRQHIYAVSAELRRQGLHCTANPWANNEASTRITEGQPRRENGENNQTTSGRF